MADITRIVIGDTSYKLVDEEARQISASGMVIKGTVATAEAVTGLTNYVSGWCYKASATFTVPDLGTLENGDMLIAISDGATFSASDWCVLQNNVDTFTGATSSAAGTRGLVPAPTTSDTNKYLKGDGTWGEIENSDDTIAIVDTTIFTSSQEGVAGNTVFWGSKVGLDASSHVGVINDTSLGDISNGIMYMD